MLYLEDDPDSIVQNRWSSSWPMRFCIHSRSWSMASLGGIRYGGLTAFLDYRFVHIEQTQNRTFESTKYTAALPFNVSCSRDSIFSGVGVLGQAAALSLTSEAVPVP